MDIYHYNVTKTTFHADNVETAEELAELINRASAHLFYADVDVEQVKVSVGIGGADVEFTHKLGEPKELPEVTAAEIW